MSSEDKTCRALIALLSAQEKKLDSLYGALCKRLSKILYVHQGKIAQNKALRAKLHKLIKDFERRLYLLIASGMENACYLAQRSLARLLSSLPLSKQVKESYLKPLAKSPYESPSALKTEAMSFSFKLSQRVWKRSRQNQVLIEMTLKQGIEKGTSASYLARALKRYLKEPDKLFRRLREGEGAYKLSQAARDYKPGAGVYRSPYRNALRLARSEINRAYRREENQRWRAMPFVLGFEVKRSKGASKECLCDALAGVYPKEFIFSGWHPNCLCQALPVLAGNKEFLAYAKGQAIAPGSYIKELPSQAKAWLAEHGKRIRAYQSEPLFIRENFLWDEKQKGYRLRVK